MADQIEEVKSKTDIVTLISEHIELRKAGRNYKALCPFHSEKTPSFYVSSELQIFKCFGCQKGGDVFTFLEEYEGMDFGEALKFLAQRAGVKLDIRNFGERSEKEKLYNINFLAAKFYHYILLNHQAGRHALDYLLKERKIRIDTIKTFGLGYSPDMALAFKKYLLEKKKIHIKDLEKAGLVYLRNGTPFDRFRGRIIFPLHDHRGNIVGFSGRILPGKFGDDIAKYINTPETKIYHKSKVLYGLNLNKNAIKKSKEAVVMEGELDLISSWQVGIENAVAIKGSALTGEQIDLLERYCDRIVLALDADVAGNEAAVRGIELAEKKGMEVKVATIKGFKDPDEAAQKDPGKLKIFLADAKVIWDYLISSVFSMHKKMNVQDKAEISKRVIPILAKIQDKIVQAHYIEVVSKKLGVPVEAVSGQLEKVKVEAKTFPKIEVAVKVQSKSRRELLEERFLGVIFRHSPELLLANSMKKLIQTPLSKRILQEFRDYSKEKKKFDPSIFAAKLPKELVEGYVDLILKDIKGLEDESPERFKKEIKLIEKELETLIIKEKLEKVAGFIKDFEGSGKSGELNKAQREFSILTNKLNKLEEENLKGIIL